MSSIYETAPQGEVVDQPDFLNAVVEIETDLGPEDLLKECKRIEPELGRERAGSGTARGRSTSTCCCSATSSTSPSGCASRTAISRRRRFVLEPLRELAPDLRRRGAALATVADQPVRRTDPDLGEP